MEPYYVLGSVYSMCWQAFVQRNQSKDIYHEEQIDRSKEGDTRSRKKTDKHACMQEHSAVPPLQSVLELSCRLFWFWSPCPSLKA